MSWWSNLWRRAPEPDRVDGYTPPDPNGEAQDPWKAPAIQEALKQRAEAGHFDAEAFDGFRNELTGIGDFTRDKTFGGRAGGPLFDVWILSRLECEKRWRGSDLGARVVETVPDEMVREGFDITIQPSEDEPGKGGDPKADAFPPGGPPKTGDPTMVPGLPPPEPKTEPLPDVDQESTQMVEDICGELDELEAVKSRRQALCFGRCYGGGAVLMGIQDGMQLDQPVNEDTIESVDWLHVFTGGYDGQLVAWSYYSDIKSPKYGQPEIYMLRNLQVPYGVSVPGAAALRQVPTPAVIWIHESRLLRFGPEPTSVEACISNRGWGDSIFVRIDRVLSQFDQTWGGVASLMTDFATATLKIKGLFDMLGSNNKAGTATLTQRARNMNMSRSISNVLLIDAEEEFKRDMATVSGVEGVLQQMALRMAGAADMSVSDLFGQAPAGLNATGDSEIRYKYDKVAAKQRSQLYPQDRRLIRYIMLSKQGPTGGNVPAKWNIKYRSLYQLTELQKAELRLKCSQADASDINAGILNPGEVTVSAYGGSEYSTDRTIDFEGREKMRVQEEKDREERAKKLLEAAKNPPPEPAPNPAAPQPKAPPAPKQDHIEERNGKWVLLSRSTGEVLGTHATREEAVAQEQAIEASKHKQ